MPSWPALEFLILVVSLPSRQPGSPADGAAALDPRLGGGHTGTAARHDDAIRLLHFFVVPGGASTGEALANRPRTTSITGVPKFPGLS